MVTIGEDVATTFYLLAILFTLELARDKIPVYKAKPEVKAAD
jgi:hypothetical protein